MSVNVTDESLYPTIVFKYISPNVLKEMLCDWMAQDQGWSVIIQNEKPKMAACYLET